ncbi:hypothetical protein Glove_109g33 [Diversispora epigaea]|uniref:Uncharacterized protein n=1 Tax=Diversispora epigaea TaxID=1348612 RepID=A0A397JBN8_9GLOM|nr:hypothetical protein Glove_109g33 [Diversispora epigaea]
MIIKEICEECKKIKYKRKLITEFKEPFKAQRERWGYSSDLGDYSVGCRMSIVDIPHKSASKGKFSETNCIFDENVGPSWQQYQRMEESVIGCSSTEKEDSEILLRGINSLRDNRNIALIFENSKLAVKCQLVMKSLNHCTKIKNESDCFRVVTSLKERCFEFKDIGKGCDFSERKNSKRFCFEYGKMLGTKGVLTDVGKPKFHLAGEGKDFVFV